MREAIVLFQPEGGTIPYQRSKNLPPGTLTRTRVMYKLLEIYEHFNVATELQFIRKYIQMGSFR